ncbi:MAG: cysteine desulfurase [Bdellovibrionaceae bacterium]|nr:cysteine desulfurase [Pseudobdellovibrionaceae bacterium]|tara:strand:+ start:1643 stop:2854 length:1212 start_codon:yes stop_codon:yes gene_type:complete
MGAFQDRGSRAYFDHNATTPVDSEVLALLSTWGQVFGNPSSIHSDGRGPKALLRQARKSVAKFLNADPLEIVFTSGGSESNNMVLQGIFNWIQTGQGWNGKTTSKRNQLIISAVEHPSILKTAEFLKRRGVQVDVVPVNRQGQLDEEVYENLLSENTALVSIMYANNESGCIFPIKDLAKKAHEVGAFFHTDAVQSLGKSMVDVKDWGVDFASFSGHKFYALKGVGVTFVKKRTSLESHIFGGGQERGRRAGTENLLSIASLGHRCEGFQQEMELEALQNLRDQFEQKVKTEIQGVSIIGADSLRVPNTSNLILQGVDGETLLMNLDVEGFSVSTGAACSAGSPEPSPALLAMGYSREEAQSSLRVSFGRGNTLEEMEDFVGVLKLTVQRLRQLKQEGHSLHA